MHNSEWEREYLVRKEVVYRNNTVYVISETGYQCQIVCNSAITDAYWQGDAVIVEYSNGVRVRYYGKYSYQTENM